MAISVLSCRQAVWTECLKALGACDIEQAVLTSLLAPKAARRLSLWENCMRTRSCCAGSPGAAASISSLMLARLPST